PNDHVNRCQSSNDVIPSAMQLSATVAIHEELVPALTYLKDVLDGKAKEFMPVIKTGRTHLQDATPIRLGQEFLGYAGQVERSVNRVRLATDELAELPLGGTAVGAHEHDRHVPDTGEVHGLVKIPLGRRPIAEEGHDHRVVTAILR